MMRWALRADDLLRGQPDLAGQFSRRAAVEMLVLAVLCGSLYGAAMGCFAGVTGDRLLQVLYSASKVPLLLTVTFALSLPSFFVLNTLLGVRDDFGQSMRALLAAQAGLTLVLLSLAPITLWWYASSADYPTAILFNGLMFAVASFGGQVLLRRYYQPLVRRNPRHRTLLRLWVVVYVFVGIQMGWVLRPFVGDPARPTQFFREGAWGNAYEVVARMVWQVLSQHR